MSSYKKHPDARSINQYYDYYIQQTDKNSILNAYSQKKMRDKSDPVSKNPSFYISSSNIQPGTDAK